MDLGSWARFEPTLAAFLDGPARPEPQAAGRPRAAGPGQDRVADSPHLKGRAGSARTAPRTTGPPAPERT